MRRSLRILGVVALAGSLFAACGGDDDDDAPESTPAPTRTTNAATATPSPNPAPARAGGTMILATTTSTQDSGLLDVLVPQFTRQTGTEVKVIAAGTGAALEMAAKGDADAVLVHAPESEKRYVDQGDLVEGKLVMHNDFVILGPANDPAKVKGEINLRAALTKIAAAGPFISRGDRSGTHTKELELWTAAGVSLASVRQREETGQGMGATLAIADQKRGYVLADRGTYLALKKNFGLVVVFEKTDARLLNVYHVYSVNPVKHTGVKAPQARAFAAFMVDAETQRLIGEFRRAEFGEPLFIADAGKSEDQLARP